MLEHRRVLGEHCDSSRGSKVSIFTSVLRMFELAWVENMRAPDGSKRVFYLCLTHGSAILGAKSESSSGPKVRIS